MTFDSDSPVARSPYSGRHRKEPSYLRAVRNMRLRGVSWHPEATTEPAPPLPPAPLAKPAKPADRLRLVRLPEEEQTG